MKKIIVLAASLMIAATAMAQIRVGGGYLNNSIDVTSGNTTTTSVLNGAYAGISYTIPINEMFHVAPGVFYSYLTGNQAFLGATVKNKTVRHDINIPLFVGYGADLDAIKVSLSAGPMFTYGLKGTTTTSASIAGLNLSAGDVDLFDSALHNSRFDLKIATNASVGFGAFAINAGYAYGIVDQITDNDNLNSLSKYAWVGVSYAF